MDKMPMPQVRPPARVRGLSGPKELPAIVMCRGTWVDLSFLDTDSHGFRLFIV